LLNLKIKQCFFKILFNISKIVAELFNLILISSFETVVIEPGIYLNRGPRVELFTLSQRKPFTVCVVDIINHLVKLNLSIAIKLDVEIKEIEKALKASELKEKVTFVLPFLVISFLNKLVVTT
jgi:hypothetical protein